MHKSISPKGAYTAKPDEDEDLRLKIEMSVVRLLGFVGSPIVSAVGYEWALLHQRLLELYGQEVFDRGMEEVALEESYESPSEAPSDTQTSAG